MASVLVEDVYVPQIKLPAHVVSTVKKHGGEGAVAQVEAAVVEANNSARNRALSTAFDEKMSAVYDKMRALSKAIPTYALTAAGGSVVGFAIGWFGYQKLRDYFGAESYAPDVIVIGAGILVGASSMIIKYVAKDPAAHAPERFGLIGAGIGLAAAGAAQTYYTWFAA